MIGFSFRFRFSLDRKRRSRKRSRKKMKTFWFFWLRLRHAYDSAYDPDFHEVISALTTPLTTPTPSLVKTSLKCVSVVFGFPRECGHFWVVFKHIILSWFKAGQEKEYYETTLPARLEKFEALLKSRDEGKGFFLGDKVRARCTGWINHT